MILCPCEKLVSKRDADCRLLVLTVFSSQGETLGLSCMCACVCGDEREENEGHCEPVLSLLILCRFPRLSSASSNEAELSPFLPCIFNDASLGTR